MKIMMEMKTSQSKEIRTQQHNNTTTQQPMHQFTRFGTFSTVQDYKTSGQERIFIWLCGNGDILLAMPLAMIPPSYFIHLGRFKSY